MRFLTSLTMAALAAIALACGGDGGAELSEVVAADVDYCAVESDGARVETVRPQPGEAPVDDVNWFARPVLTPDGAWVVGFASHNQNYLYDLGSGQRIKIPDRSDAVATPDGRYITVPSNYTPDEYIRFYDAAPLLEHLARGEDADDQPPVYIHRHPDLRKVYYQSTALMALSADTRIYRLMFSGTRSESGFRIVDYAFVTEGGRLRVTPSEPMKLCPEIRNDLNTPFISKDGRHVVSYTSDSEEQEYSSGSSLKIFRIAETFPELGTTRCEEVVDFGFAAGKADFSFDGSQLTFHISKGAYLTPFINGGLETPTITDVVVVDLERDDANEITGYSNLRRITTSTREGVGSYFPAFFPDGNLYYLFNAAPKDSEEEKRFFFKVVSPEANAAVANVFADPSTRRRAVAIGQLWHQSCAPEQEPPAEHEAPWALLSLSGPQCQALVEERWTEAVPAKSELLAACRSGLE